ncbi:lipopolysaccharide assembly protein LapB [Geobacter sp. SVR]|uniref:tetratricopeptide repeat protein n=1 Tax=Geobacter sp. SVR TaxID=2495594 RepID=UPI00143F00D5|nr:tetratricopeptide repeat protein [Geobacter sp. SVR]BCS54248.1 hypothetical protein GSVR_25560 [Geobacter sp. SVR]GCF85894.1 hypothetical protein GSbR_24940 [Geobacter sp. SVR]
MRFSSILYAALCCVFLPGTASAATELYTGTMEIFAVSGNACGGLELAHNVSLFLRRDRDGSPVSGFFQGATITTGKFSGKDLSKLEVRYPYHDELRASGHSLSITPAGGELLVELRDRHLEPGDDDCNFDLARMRLTRTGKGESVESLLKPVSAMFEAQLLRSEAYDLAGQGRYEEALPLYEKALAMADASAGGDAGQMAAYVVGLAGTYVRLGRFAQFSRLYDERIGVVSDAGIRDMLAGQRVRSGLLAGKAALVAEDYKGALQSFRKAYSLQPHNVEAVAAVMTAQVRMGDHDGAIAFLENVLASAESDGERQGMRGALAHVYFLRAQKYDRNGAETAAEADLEKADALDPYSPQYLVARARLLHKRGSLEDAEKLLQQGLRRFPLESSQQEILAARDKMRATEAILEKLRKVGS